MALSIRVGMAISLSGRYSVQGRQSFHGLSLWVEDVNRSGGIWVRGRGKLPVELLHYDDEGERDRCAKLVERLIAEDKIDILVGPYSSGLVEAACPVAERHGKVLWNHGGASDRIFGRGFKYVVGLLTPASRYFVGFLDFVRRVSPDSNRVVIVGRNSSFSSAIADGARSHADKNGFQVSITNFGDLLGLLDELAAGDPQVILGAGRMQDDMALAKELKSRKINARFVALVAAPMGAFRDALGQDAEGFYGPSQWEADAEYKIDFGPTPEDFRERFKAAYGVEPDYPAAQGYAIGLVAQKCIEEAGTLDNDRLREAAGRLKFTTFYGDFKIDPLTGIQAVHRMVLICWRGGRKEIVWPA